jgi:hypothetical protein
MLALAESLEAGSIILMANSRHFVANQPAFLRSCERQLARPGRFLIVEYDTDAASPTAV